MEPLQVGDKTYSKFFGSTITIVRVNSDQDWYFTVDTSPEKGVLKAQSPLSMFVRV